MYNVLIATLLILFVAVVLHTLYIHRFLDLKRKLRTRGPVQEPFASLLPRPIPLRINQDLSSS